MMTPGSRYHMMETCTTIILNQGKTQFRKNISCRLISNLLHNRTWSFSIDGSECTTPAKIKSQFYQNNYFDYRFPATITGYCKSAGGRQIKKGLHNIIFSIHNDGGGYTTITCWNSVCRIVIEEVPPPVSVTSGGVTVSARYISTLYLSKHICS